MTYNPFKSKTNWTLVAMVILTAVQADVQFMPPTWQAIVTGLLGVAAIIFHTTTAQAAGAVN